MSAVWRCVCGVSTSAPLDVARAKGWRIWDGESQTGAPMVVRICPACVDPEAAPPPPSWRAGCRTCDWEYEGEDGPLSESDARDMGVEHRCEPDTYVLPPVPEEEVRRQEAMVASLQAALVPLGGGVS